MVSQKISEGDLKSLHGLVTDDVIPTIQKAASLMSLSQREQISVNAEDIYFSFPYQVIQITLTAVKFEFCADSIIDLKLAS